MVDASSLNPGDRIEVEWADISEDPVGDVSKATLAKRLSIGIFQAVKESLGIPCLVTTTTEDEKDQSQSGYCIYPLAVVLRLKVVKKKRVGRKKKVIENGSGSD